jgi:hypothetical protein
MTWAMTRILEVYDTMCLQSMVLRTPRSWYYIRTSAPVVYFVASLR